MRRACNPSTGEYGTESPELRRLRIASALWTWEKPFGWSGRRPNRFAMYLRLPRCQSAREQVSAGDVPPNLLECHCQQRFLAIGARKGTLIRLRHHQLWLISETKSELGSRSVKRLSFCPARWFHGKIGTVIGMRGLSGRSSRRRQLQRNT